MSGMRNENDPELIMMGYVIRDEETDEIIGISEDAPEEVKAFYEAYMDAMNSTEPIEMD